MAADLEAVQEGATTASVGTAPEEGGARRAGIVERPVELLALTATSRTSRIHR